MNKNGEVHLEGGLFSPSNQKVPGFPFPSVEVQHAVSRSSPRIFTEHFHRGVEFSRIAFHIPSLHLLVRR